MAIAWNDTLYHSHEHLDDDHRVMAALINRLYLCVNENVGQGAVAAAARELFKFSSAHFSHEKELMLAHDYPEVASHLAEHKILLDELQGLILNIENNGGTARPATVEFLDDWFATHLRGADTRFGAFLKK